jgi:thiol-disulfide isomerase/thioredoxin
MKNQFYALFIFSFLGFKGQTASEGIKFEHQSWQKILHKAETEKKLIFLDAYASWCGPCKWMAKNVFTDNEVASYYNKTFINAKIDMELDEGPDLAAKYGVMAYPTFLFIDASGKVVHRICGGMQTPDFINQGKIALNIKERFSALENNYSTNNQSETAAYDYFGAAELACTDFYQEVKNYLDRINSDQFYSEKNFSIIERFISDFNHQSFTYLLQNYDKGIKLYGKKRLDEKIANVYQNAIVDACREGNDKYIEVIRSHFSAQPNAPVQMLSAFTAMSWSRETGDTSVFFNSAIEYADNFLQESPSGLNNLAWTFYEATSNPAHLSKALLWAEKSIALAPDYSNTDTYAHLLFKKGKYEDAYKQAQSAIDIGKKMGENVKGTEELLEAISIRLKN